MVHLLKTIIVHTRELDDFDAAIASINSQIENQGGLKSNSVGIIACHYEFILSDMVKAICEALPISTVGAVSVTQAVKEDADQLLLTITILTSDDVSFKTCYTTEIDDSCIEPVENAYREALVGDSEEPALMMAFSPIYMHTSGDELSKIFNTVSGGVPCFGTFAIDETGVFEHAYTIFNGEFSKERVAMLLIYGDVQPHFFLASVSPDRVQQNSALVTKSDKQVLMEVNNKPVGEYFESFGLLDPAKLDSFSLASITFVMDYGDGMPPVSRVFVTYTPDGYAVCAGEIPEGTSIKIGSFNKDDVIQTACKSVGEALEIASDKSCMLMYSCFSRSMSLGSELLAEVDAVRELIGDQIPYMIADSGGEFCPTHIGTDRTVNRFHNNTYIICVI